VLWLCAQVTDAGRFQRAIADARSYLEAQLSVIDSDPYALNIVGYALTLGRSRHAATALRKAAALAITEGLCTLYCHVYHNDSHFTSVIPVNRH